MNDRSRPRSPIAGPALFVTVLAAASAVAEVEWRSYGNDHTEQRFSPIDQVNRSNVGELGLDWALSVPDAVSLNSTPLMIDGVLYFSADRAIVHAVDARSGKLIWSYDPQSWKHAPRGIGVSFNTNRGIAHSEGSIFVGTADGRLVSLDARTGRVKWATRTFGREERKAITGAPRAFDGKVFIGNGGAESSPLTTRQMASCSGVFTRCRETRPWALKTTPWRKPPRRGTATGGRCSAAGPYGTG